MNWIIALNPEAALFQPFHLPHVLIMIWVCCILVSTILMDCTRGYGVGEISKFPKWLLLMGGVGFATFTPGGFIFFFSLHCMLYQMAPLSASVMITLFSLFAIGSFFWSFNPMRARC